MSCARLHVLGDLCDSCDFGYKLESTSPVNFDRLAWIDEQVAVAVANYEKMPRGGSVRFDACQILGVVSEFAELLRVHYAGGE